MSKVVLIGLPGEDGLWMVDLDKGTVAAMPEDFASKVAEAGKPIIKGVDVAIAISPGSPVLSGKFDTVEMPIFK